MGKAPHPWYQPPMCSNPESDREPTVTVDGTTHVVPETGLSFGRDEACDLTLDAADVGISRRAGSIEREAGTWWLVNRSGSRPLSVIDELGLRSLLAPGRRAALEAPVTVIIEGSQSEHALAVRVPRLETPADPTVPSAEGLLTAVGEGVLVNDADRLALVALFAGYLQDYPRHDPNPKSYAAAAARLGWPRTTLVKRIEYLRTRLANAGVPGLMGWNAMYNLAEYVITTGIITKDDLPLVFPEQ
jgi:hypothetical protein